MATTLSLTTSFIGDAATELINKMFYSAKTIADGGLTIKDDINKSYAIRRLAGTGLIQAPTCDFTPLGTMTITEQTLTPAPFEVNVQLCKKDFKHVDWSSVRMGTGQGRTLSQDVIDAVIAEILGHVGNEIEMSIWRGNTAGTTYTLIDGLQKILAAGVAAGNKTTPAVITSANVVAALGSAYTIAAAQSWIDAPDLAFYVAPNIAAAYKQALGNLGYMDQFAVGDKPMNYNGIQIYTNPGLETSNFILTHKANLYFGTESVSNFNEVMVKDMHEVDLSDNVRFAAYATMGVQVGWFEEVVLHTDT